MPPAARPCRSADLEATAEQPWRPLGSEPGDTFMSIVLSNISGGTCSLQGWAGLSVFGDDMPVACNGDHDPGCGKGRNTTEPRTMDVTRVPGLTADLVVLAAGERTSYSLLWSEWRSAGCDATAVWNPPYGARIRIPGDSRPLTVAPLPQMHVCGGRVRLAPIGALFPSYGGTAGGTG
ncbi:MULTISPECIES: DUF4232 domain-containing protein [unclassified Streptomyces]|uniref:DUF4232 domain-containing protein n=1 Tax=unclassified Streptomyces TaxID=2593676 RepID=UPI0037F55856